MRATRMNMGRATARPDHAQGGQMFAILARGEGRVVQQPFS
jgi:hypothetical protein